MKLLSFTCSLVALLSLTGCQTASMQLQRQAEEKPQHPAIKIFEDICLNSYPANDSALKTAAVKHGIRGFETKYGKGMFGPYQYESGSNTDQSMFVTYWPGKAGCVLKVKSNTQKSDEIIYHVQLGKAVQKKYRNVDPMQKSMTTYQNGKVIQFTYFNMDGFDYFSIN
ncbi:hypothetical protein CQ054_20055 [Ochrobactrum sp. MYb29]|nr:hypothetical protein CQ054_20055 [Ochrobactrum sp. MYb29]